ncbi:shikimate dehydrogenase [Actibacterium pelagium]|uniref:Shikimate dehydrogenase (NADP(+)) n=1 Tax=Actibacterium pelagium TaxID=2029103 RepID=A0A917AF02_9RHOB|nr:shikimate dehydrogenase [Actibacterium pelagium]GGE43726.1 shikimate dehydrogenase (NADP(+)) [Actibacterium pelagium]
MTSAPAISSISGKTRLIGLFGSPVDHSRSPVMQNSTFEAMGLDYVYLAFDVGGDHVEEAVSALRALNMRGANVTMPLKRAIIPHLDALSEAAELAGAVNVIVNDEGKLTGQISDGEGFMLSLRDAGHDVVGQRMVILGAGGAAIAVAVQAALDGVSEIVLFNRRDAFFEEARGLIERLQQRDLPIRLADLEDHALLAEAIRDADILVNATPVGMEGSLSKTALPDLELLRAELLVCDLIYVPRETRLLREAAARGCRTVPGTGMQLWQAAPAFRLWTGVDMDMTVARQALYGADT